MNALHDALLPQLALFALASSLSSGPDNLLIAAAGARSEVRRSLRALAGMYAGFVLMIATTALGASAALGTRPWLLEALQLGGVVYLLYLAAGLLRAPWVAGRAAIPAGFVGAAMLQFTRLKLWLMVGSTVALCARTGPEGADIAVPLLAYFVLMTVPSVLLYLNFGSLLSDASPRVHARANLVLAALAALSALLLLPPTHAEAL